MHNRRSEVDRRCKGGERKGRGGRNNGVYVGGEAGSRAHDLYAPPNFNEANKINYSIWEIEKFIICIFMQELNEFISNT